MLPNINPTTTVAWKKLRNHRQVLEDLNLREWFLNDPLRFQEFSITYRDILFDFSKNFVRKDTIEYLAELGEACQISECIEKLFGGDKINTTEGRSVQHMALRNFSEAPSLVEGKDVKPLIASAQNKMQKFSEQLIQGRWKGFSGEAITDVVNIGIGGSDLGPKMVYEALKPYQVPNINCHFVSNIDASHLEETLKGLNPHTTLFIISSKTFTTQETMTNAKSAREWFTQNTSESDIARHFVAVSTNGKAVSEFGIDIENMFGFWDWTGGRFSVWSSIGLSLCCGLGYTSFEKLLKGAHYMDEHFKNAPLTENIPFIMGMLSVWYTNFWGASTEAILPYEQNLRYFPSYIQQVSMESNGKSVDRNGGKVEYATAPISWGEPGTNGQHAFYQLLHQGKHLVPCDFIAFAKSNYRSEEHHQKLLANFFAQTEALMKGRTLEEVDPSGMDKDLLSHKVFEGNRPTTSILAPELNETTLGILMSCYEHKTFVQGAIWNIFSFDQWGVELGKTLANIILPELSEDNTVMPHDSSTSGLIKHYKNLKALKHSEKA